MKGRSDPRKKKPPDIPSKDILSALFDNEAGDARLFANLNQNVFCYDHNITTWFRWTGNVWDLDYLNESLESVSKVIKVYQREAQSQAEALRLAAEHNDSEAKTKAERLGELLNKRINVLNTLARRRNVLTLAAAGENSLGLKGDQWDQNPHLLGCENGVVDLRTCQFREGNPEDYIRTFAPTSWKSVRTSRPQWEQFLMDVFDDEELILYVQRLLGYGISGLSSEHIFPIFWGEGRNGKGTLLEVLRFVLGPLMSPVEAELLLKQDKSRSSAAPSPDIMALQGKRLVWASETEEDRQFLISKVKWLTGGDTLTGRSPFARYMTTFNPTHTMILITNHKPRANAEEIAFWDRVHLVPFVFRFVDEPKADNEKPKILGLKEKLQQEAPGILAWLVEGFLAWQEKGLCPPESVRVATESYRSEEDFLAQFIEDSCVIGEGAMVQAGALYEKYRAWCIQNDIKAISQRKFGGQMKKVGDVEKTKLEQGIFYVGIGLLQ